MIDITNVVNISVSAPPAGLAPYSVNNILCLTKDVPVVAPGTSKYRIYTNPTDVATDWGTGSNVYKAAVAVFSQSPNILTGGGVFIVSPMLTTVTVTPDVTTQEVTIYTQTISGTAFAFTSDATPTAAEVVTGLKALINAGSTGVVATGSTTLILNGTVPFTHSESAKLTAVETSEVLDAAINRVKALVYFGGVSYTYTPSDGDITSAAAVCQTYRKLMFVGASAQASLESGGILHTLKGSTSTYSRGLFYTVAADLYKMVWGYAGRGMSTNFSGTNTTQTMHLKQISGLVADPGINSTVLAAAQAVGADCYIDIASRASLFTSGANGFFDDMYNLSWYAGALEVAGFNAQATSSTKLPQTEVGMDVLKDAYRAVCIQAVANRFAGPGTWTSPDTFGNQASFVGNIADVGFYIYSQPVSTQSPADRALRKAPLIQIALKFQGAIHSSSVIVNVNQ